MKLVILGGSGIGMIAAYIGELLGFQVLGFLNDGLRAGEKIGQYKRYPVLGGTEKYRDYLDDPDILFFIAYVGLGYEKKHFEKIDTLEIPRSRYATLIHPTAVIPWGFCKIGSGVLFGAHSQLSPDTTVADNCILLGGSFLGHDSVMNKMAHIATNGVVGANVKLGKNVHVGSNAVIREKVSIGDFALVGSGSVVLQDVPANKKVVGNPAQILEPRSVR